MAHVDPDYFKSKLEYFIKIDFDTEDSTEKESLADGIIAKMEKADWNCDEALVSVIPSIGDEVIRNDCRRILLSCKFKAALFYRTKSSSKQPWLDYVWDDCALIQYYENNGTSTTAIISPTGEVKTRHGQIWINGNSMSYRRCFNARGVGEYKDKAGLVYHDGTILLPCIFNYIENGVVFRAQYNGVEFSVRFSDKPLKEDVNPLGRSYQVSDGFFVIVECLGLTDVVYDHPAINILRMKDDKQLTRQEAKDLIERRASEVFTILDGLFLL